MTEYLSDETQEMLAVVDKYEDGDINLEEAVKMIQYFSSIEEAKIREILNGVERENLLKFPTKNS